jgi:L-ribulokinase
MSYTIGIDFGQTACRAVLIDTADGSERACAIEEYSTGIMLHNFFGGVMLPEGWAIADTQDYLEVIGKAVRNVADKVAAAEIVGIGIAFSSCCVLPVKADGTPLCALHEFKNNPHAYIKVTRHRSAVRQAEKIASAAKQYNEPWAESGSNCASPEWILPKVLEILDEAPTVYEAADYFVEATDWIVWQLTGNPVRNSFSASFKAQCRDGAVPSRAFLKAVDPRLEDFYDKKLNIPIASPVTCAGGVTRDMAVRLGLKAGTPVAVGSVDVLACLPALKVYTEGTLVGIMGKSSIFLTLSDKSVSPKGISRGEKGSVIPNLYTYKFNQTCVGDSYAWYLSNYLSPEYHNGAKSEGRNLHSYIAQRMIRLKPGENGIIALNWLRGSKCPINDRDLSAMFVGMDESTRSEHLYRAMIEGMAFDTRFVIEELTRCDIAVDSFCGVGTIAERNPFITQLYADILGMPVMVAATEKSPALGAAVIAAAVSGAYSDIAEASENMGAVSPKVYMPDVKAVRVYNRMYEEYRKLRIYFSEENNSIMHNLKDIKASVK